MSAIDDIIESLNKAAGEVMDEKEAVVEDLKADFKKDDEFISDTIKTRKSCIIDKKEKSSKSKNAAFKSSSTYSFDDDEKDKKEDKKDGYYGSYYGGYGYGYGYSEQKKTDAEKKKESAKEKSKTVFKEAAKRASESKSEDLFTRHKAITSPSKQSKTKDSFKGGLITAVLEACKTIIEIMEE